MKLEQLQPRLCRGPVNAYDGQVRWRMVGGEKVLQLMLRQRQRQRVSTSSEVFKPGFHYPS